MVLEIKREKLIRSGIMKTTKCGVVFLSKLEKEKSCSRILESSLIDSG